MPHSFSWINIQEANIYKNGEHVKMRHSESNWMIRARLKKNQVTWQTCKKNNRYERAPPTCRWWPGQTESRFCFRSFSSRNIGWRTETKWKREFIAVSSVTNTAAVSSATNPSQHDVIATVRVCMIYSCPWGHRPEAVELATSGSNNSRSLTQKRLLFEDALQRDTH